jgi:hypothetical protein
MLTAALGYYSDLAPFSVGQKTGSELKLRVHRSSQEYVSQEKCQIRLLPDRIKSTDISGLGMGIFVESALIPI